MGYLYSGKELVTGPITEPITLAEAHAQLHIPDAITTEDALINTYIKSARELAERVTGRAIMTQEWKVFFSSFPYVPYLELPFPPLQDITHLKYYDSSGALQTLIGGVGGDDPLVEIVLSREPGQIRLIPTGTWPSTATDRTNSVEAQFTAGYASASAVPAQLKTILLCTVTHLYENRGELDLCAFEKLLMGHRVWSIY